MSNEELLAQFADYLDVVSNGIDKVAATIRGRVAESDAPRCQGYAVRAYRFLYSWPPAPDSPRPMDSAQTKQAVLVAVESYAESHALQKMTGEDYSLESGFQRDALEIFFGFLQIVQAKR